MDQAAEHRGFRAGLKAVAREHFGQHKILYLAFLIFLVPFFITRLPFFLHYPVVTFDADYLHYFMVVDQMDKGFWPTFVIRTPGYPLFLKLIYTVCSRNMAAVAAQNMLTLLVGLFFIFVVYRVYREKIKYLALLAAVGLAAFVSSSLHLNFDTTQLTESVFVNLLLLSFALLILALHKKRTWPWVLCSLTMALVITVRPTGMFLLPIGLVILAFLVVNRHRVREILGFVLPFMGVFLLVSFYNWLTIGLFSFVGHYSEHALVSFTATFLEEKPSYSPEVNEIIRKSRSRIGAKHRRAIAESWDPKPVSRALRRHYNRNRHFIFDSLLALEDKEAHALYLEWRPLLKDMGWTAIRKNPATYLKFVYANLVFYFFHNMKDLDFYDKLGSRYARSRRLKLFYEKAFSERDSSISGLRWYYKKDYVDTVSVDFLQSFLKELWQPAPLTNIEKVTSGGKREVQVEATALQRVHILFKKIHDIFFRNILWPFVSLFALIFSLFKLVTSRFRHRGALIMFVLTLSLLGHALIICMTSFAIPRYSCTMEFVYYLSLFLLPIVTPRETPVDE